MSPRNNLCCVLLLWSLYGFWLTLVGMEFCDGIRDLSVPEGDIGQLGAFPWLGVLRVQLRDTDNVGLSGLVLVRERFALANADDVIRIPMLIFRMESRAVFYPATGSTWSCQATAYKVHPEYQPGLNTIAIIQLEGNLNDGKIPIKPICWSPVPINASVTQQYVVGFTDENGPLNKMIYQLEYVPRTLCDAFYLESGLLKYETDSMRIQCAVAKNATNGCTWENGMLSVTNHTGTWELVALASKGPACTWPARLLHISDYYDWVQMSCDNETRNFRRSSNNFLRQSKKEIEEAILETGNFSNFRADTTVYREERNDVYYKVDRVDADAINIKIFDNVYEDEEGACNEFRKQLVYKDVTKLVGSNYFTTARVAYRVTLYNMLVSNYSCVKLHIKSQTRDRAKIWWMEEVDRFEGTGFGETDLTPKGLMKYVPNLPRTTPAPKSTYEASGGLWVPPPEMEPTFIDDAFLENVVENVNILVTFFFRWRAELTLRVYGSRQKRKWFTNDTEEDIDRDY